MIKYLFVLICVCCLCGHGFSQAVPEKFIPKKNVPETTPKPVTKKPVRATERVREQTTEAPTPRVVREPQPKLQIVFSASDDCIIEIDGKWYGSLEKDEPRTIPLDFGQHKLLAQSKATREVYNTTITILGDKQAVNIPMKELAHQASPPPDNLDYSTVAVVQPLVNEPIRIEQDELSPEPVPVYVSQNSVLATAGELSTSMVPVPGGKFARDDRKSSGKKNKDSVEVAAFLLGKFEVTQQQWQQVMGYNNSENKNCNDCPVENVSWTEVTEFIGKLNQSSDIKFRLPTSAEWDYVVRMDVREYIDKRGGPRYGDNVAWNENNSERKTHSVGTRIPHRSGAYDLMGNVAEWCSDWYDAEYLKSTKNNANPSGPASGTTKVVRGGSFANKDFIDLQHRDPKEKAKNIGFRLVQN